MSEHYDFHYQPTGSGAISGQQVLEQTEDAINELGDYVNDNVGGAMDVAQQALETAQNAEQDAQTALDTANSFSSAIQSAQQDASTALSTAQTAQTTAGNAINLATTASQDASSAVTTANNASGQVSTLSGTVTTLGQRVTTAEGNIGQNTSDITALTTRVGTAEGNITTLQNDVSIAQGNASSAMATAGTVKQQAFVFRYSSSSVTDNSTIAYSTLDNTDNVKSGDKVIDVDGKIFSVVSVDTTNQTVTVGSALIDLALDANVVHTSGNETVGGVKTFSDNISTKKIISNAAQLQINARSNADSIAVIAGTDASEGGGFWAYGKDSANGSDCRLQIYNTSKSRYEHVDLVGSQFLPTPSGEIDCGGTLNKWKSFNGLNPGCLSLPDFSNAIDISSYITITGGSTTNSTYTPLANGYISVNLGRSSGAIGLVLSNGKIEACVRENTFPDNHKECGGFIPVQKNDNVVITSCLADSIIWAYFIPCLGNV